MKTCIKVCKHKLINLISCLLLIIFASTFHACHHKHIEELKPQAQARLTVIVYICAENKLCAYYEDDVKEMLEATTDIPEDCNLLVYVDEVKSPTLYSITSENGKKTILEYEECNSADPEVFKQKLKGIMELFPADHYGLVLWSHGSGWIPNENDSKKELHKSIFVDNNFNSPYMNSGSELEIPDMANVLHDLGVTWDYIFFDACFMQCVEVDYELRNVCQYIIASPAEIPGEGAPYHKVMPYLMHKDASAPLEKQVEGIVREYYDFYKTSQGIVLSAVKTSEMENLLKVTKRLVPNYYEEAYDLNMADVQCYGSYAWGTNWRPEYYDMASTMKRILPPTSFEEWMHQLDNTVVYRGATAFWYSMYTNYCRIPDLANTSLMTIFVPNENYDERTTYNTAIKTTQWYKAFVEE